MASLDCWIWLALLQGVSPRAKQTLIREFGSPEAVMAADTGALAKASGLPPSVFERRDADRAQDVLSECRRLGIAVLPQDSPDYPALLRQIPDPPCVLFVKGRLPDLNRAPGVAVVGPRRISDEGLHTAKFFSYQLAAAGLTVVSGMALGCDAAAHSGALEALKPTVAVLGCGPDICYPPENENLYADIPRTGALISEYPPGTAPAARNFPMRNRIISGISRAVLVPEAGSRSGALITAAAAVEQNREIYAVPGSIYNPCCVGTNGLLKQGARCATSVLDIVESVIPSFRGTPAEDKLLPPDKDRYIALKKTKTKKKKTAADSAAPHRPAPRHVTAEELAVIANKAAAGIVPLKPGEIYAPSEPQKPIIAALMKGELTAEQVMRATGGEAMETVTELTMLEINGVLEQTPGHTFRLLTREFK